MSPQFILWGLVLGNFLCSAVTDHSHEGSRSTAQGLDQLGDNLRWSRYLVAHCGHVSTREWPLLKLKKHDFHHGHRHEGGRLLDAYTKAGEGASVVNAMPSEPSSLWRIAFCDTIKNGTGNFTDNQNTGRKNVTRLTHKSSSLTKNSTNLSLNSPNLT